ncbi:MAG: CBS domain-containing protein [Nitrospinales bacterium]
MNIKKYDKVREVMKPNVEFIDGLATVADAIHEMRENRFGSLIVSKRDESDEYGFVNVQAIARLVIEPNLSPERVSVYEIMEKPVLSVHGDMNIRYAIRVLERANQPCALVIDDNNAAGIVTLLDMVVRYIDQ